jgi:hypothetical protein
LASIGKSDVGWAQLVRDGFQVFGQDQIWETVDPGIADKGLLIIEPEFASAISVMEWNRNTRSPDIRQHGRRQSGNANAQLAAESHRGRDGSWWPVRLRLKISND